MGARKGQRDTGGSPGIRAWRARVRAEALDAASARTSTSRTRSFTPEQRRQAVQAWRASGQTAEEFARHVGVSAQSVRNWAKRYGEGGAGSVAAVRKPRGRPPLAEAVKAQIVDVRRRFPAFGLRKVRDFLRRFGGLKVSTGSVRKTLAQAQLPREAPVRRKRRAPPKVKSFERARAGELWQTDITYLRLPGDSRPLYLVAFLDDFSRFVVAHGLHTHMKAEIATEALLEGIRRWGRPKEVLSDQGRQYCAWRGKTAFQKLLRREGIEHAVARAHHPMTVGKTERFWKTLKEEFWDVVRPQDLAEARERLVHWVRHYNFQRSHSALEGLTPADRFFGAQEAIEKAIAQEVKENELRLALGESPRKPVFLVGQIGEETVSLHGERGRVVIQTGDGVRREIGMEALGMAGAKEAAVPPPESKETVKETSKETSHEREPECGDDDDAQAQAGGAQADEVRRALALPAAGEGPVAGGERGGSGAGAPGGGDGDRGLAGADLDRGGGEAPGGAAASVLADEPAGGGGDAGGAARAAQDAREGADDASSRGGPGAPSSGGDGASP